MSYIGNQITSVPFNTDVFSGNSSNTRFGPLSRVPYGTASVGIFVDGAYQTPTADYTLDGDYVDFTAAPNTGTNNIVVLHLGIGYMAQLTPASGTVTQDAMTANSITSRELTNSAVQANNISANAVTATAIADNAVLSNNIIDRAVTSEKLANTVVTIGTYGGGENIPVITVDQQGRLTFAANVAVQAPIPNLLMLSGM